MKESYLLKGRIKFGKISFSPCYADFEFDKEKPGYSQKKGKLYIISNQKARCNLSTLSKILSSRNGFSFISRDRFPRIELQGILPTTIRGSLGTTKKSDLIKFADFTYESFIEKYRENKGRIPREINFIIEDFVLFRPSLKITGNLIPDKREQGYFRVSIGRFNNHLQFNTKSLEIKTLCGMSGNLLPKTELKFNISVKTVPYLKIKSKDKKLKMDDLVSVGERILIILSFLEERRINHIAKLIYYEKQRSRKAAWVFEHSHNAEPMPKSWRSDLRDLWPMDKFQSRNIKKMYLRFEKISQILKQGKYLQLNLSAVFYLYLNAIKDRMVYNSICNFYACIEKILKMAPVIIQRFEYSKEEEKMKHERKAKELCTFLGIGFSDLLDKKGKFAYIRIRNDYIHNLSYKHRFEDIMDAKEKSRYLCRRVIFALLGLDYRKYNSCDPSKWGKIGP